MVTTDSGETDPSRSGLEAPGDVGPRAADAFRVVGSETRLKILQSLGVADGPLSFSTLREAVGTFDSGQFNYHLHKLDGPFVRKTDDGYVLRQAGRRIVEAILSGTLTDDSSLETTPTDSPCPFCSAPVEISYSQEWVSMYCTQCAGAYGESVQRTASEPADLPRQGYLGGLPFPPAGLRGRDGTEVIQAARTWANTETMAMAAGVCPRCAASVETTVAVCSNHDATDGLCERCDNRRAVRTSMRCENCHHSVNGPFVLRLSTNTALLSFLTSHGVNPLPPTSEFYEIVANYEEEILSTEPLEMRFSFTMDDDSICLIVDDDLDVVDATERTTTDLA